MNLNPNAIVSLSNFECQWADSSHTVNLVVNTFGSQF